MLVYEEKEDENVRREKRERQCGNVRETRVRSGRKREKREEKDSVHSCN